MVDGLETSGRIVPSPLHSLSCPVFVHRSISLVYPPVSSAHPDLVWGGGDSGFGERVIGRRFAFLVLRSF